MAALSAPMLIDSYALQRAVIASDLPGLMMESLVKAPDLIIYLRASGPTLVKQIQKRGRDYENSIRLDYLKRLNERWHGVDYGRPAPHLRETVEATRLIKYRHPGLRVIALTNSMDGSHAEDMDAAGIDGDFYIFRDRSRDAADARLLDRGGSLGILAGP